MKDQPRAGRDDEAQVQELQALASAIRDQVPHKQAVQWALAVGAKGCRGRGGGVMLSQCRVDGCFCIVDAKDGYCARHMDIKAEREAREKARDAMQWEKAHRANPEQAAVWRSGRWRKMRAEHLRTHRLCVICGKQGTSVDHIIPHRGDPALAYDPGNLQTLCFRCHNMKTRSERGQTHSGCMKNDTI